MRTGTGYVDVEYHSGGHRMDISLSRDDERNKLTARALRWATYMHYVTMCDDDII